jgi:acetylornithine deacetylase/succinyl-diaminopimelate desuccinylase-like protein
VADRELVDLASALVAIDSVNPDLVPGGAGEGEIAAFVAGWLDRAGLEVEVVESREGRPSVIGIARGTGGGRTLLLNGHLDTVSVDGMDEPFSPRVADGRLHGRGAYDMKAAVAAAMSAATAAARSRLRGDVIVAAVADEELASVGTSDVLRRVTADAAIVGEPTELQLAIAHKGFAGFRIETRGRAAHGSRPDLGVDAIVKTGPILVELGAVDERVRAAQRHALLGTGSLHASVIEGGQEYSSYPARCVVTGERRTLPGETVATVERELAGVLARARAQDPSLDASLEMLVSREPFEIDRGHELVRAVAAAAGADDVVGVPYWADSALVAAAGTPTVLFGPAGAGAHEPVEWVDLASVERCREVYLAVARAICG